MKPFSLLVKPSSADCNLRCEYCFYLEKAELYPGKRRHRMSPETLERMISSYMATDQPCYSIGWQGGEPVLMGIEFFRMVTELQQKYGRPGVSVANGLQTNATLIDDELAEHLARYNFLVGCSLDGPEDIHNRYRKTASGAGSHADVVRGINTLRKHNVEYNILVLVSRANVDKAHEVYRYLRERGFKFHQYIPCVEFDEKGRLCSFAINGEEWGRFLCEIFDEWHREDAYDVSVRHFDSVLMKMVDGVANVCMMGTDCRQYFMVEHNGDIYPCDFFALPELKLGNVFETSWQEASESPVYRDFGLQKSRMNRICCSCPWLEFCRGDCIKHRIYAGNTPENISWLCRGWKMFYEHTGERFAELAESIRSRRAEEERLRRRREAEARGLYRNIGRNDPCPCGSGKKYKKCCGNAAKKPAGPARVKLEEK